jgi:hypothetical protein
LTSDKQTEQRAQGKPNRWNAVIDKAPTTNTPIQIGPSNLEKTVCQRAGEKDCVIASVATATELPYEEIAKAFGVQLSANGRPEAGAGLDLLETIGVLFDMGWSAAALISAEHYSNADAKIKPLTNVEIKKAIVGHRAVIGYTDSDASVGPHVLAWDGNEAIDCSNATVVNIDSVVIDMALVLTPFGSSRNE